MSRLTDTQNYYLYAFTPMRASLLVLLSAASLASCGGGSEKSASTPAESSSTHSTPTISRDTTPRAADQDFQRTVYRYFARLAATPPAKEATDSITKLKSPQSIERAMNSYMHTQDSIARKVVAEKYHITVDSLTAILATGSREKW